ncbi:hypothetical protein [Oceanospirillum linum]|uniref:Uncharacterized protein n=1 Tax=Oceanospirillum linum TaxID=966 RepID=A0A1T1HA40_OCELI|nr:hypothetical protein [Oceanospirillum linum]OOV86636.1 hypothetical protein BTA35_0212145 [Oceanospirillum linum]SEG27663.1 hypothetical protein SAMN04489856_107109 [Oleiphilus messinensis]SMP27357.1 hypothetical protein SAMN06264348_106102 [Oceanospirillum linum]
MYGESVSPLMMLLPIVIYPMLAALVISFILFKLAKSGKVKTAYWLAPLVIWLAWLTAAQGIHTRWNFPPRQAMDWLLLMPLIPTLAMRTPQNIRMAGFGVALVLSFAVVAQPIVGRMSLVEIISHAIGGLLVAGITLMAAERQHNSFRFPVSLIVMMTMSALVTGISSSLSLAQMIGGICAALGAVWLMALMLKTEPQIPLLIARGSLAVWLMVLAYAHYYADVSVWALLLLALPLLIKWPSASHKKAKRPRWKDLAGTVLASVIPGLLALWLIWPEQPLY